MYWRMMDSRDSARAGWANATAAHIAKMPAGVAQQSTFRKDCTPLRPNSSTAATIARRKRITVYPRSM